MPFAPSLHAHPTAPRTPTELTSLNGLRGLAAVWVMLCHFSYPIQMAFGSSSPLLAMTKNGWIAVDFFFVLSGFIIAYTYPKGCTTWSAYKTFLARRIARIYPLHFLTLAATVFLVGAVPWGTPATSFDLLRYLTLTHTWWNYSHPIWNGVSWSISAEWGAYLLFPLLFAGVMRFRASRLPAVLVCTTLGYMVMAIFSANSHLQQIIACGLMRGLPCFTIGLLLYRLRSLHTPVANGLKKPATLALISSLAILAILPVLSLTGASPWLLLPLFLTLIFGLSFNRGATHAFLSRKPFQTLGTLSYGIYLIHYLVLKLFISHTGLVAATGASALAYLAAMVGITLLLAYASHHLLETPFRTLVRTPARPMVQPYTPRYTLPKSALSSVVPVPLQTSESQPIYLQPLAEPHPPRLPQHYDA